MQRSGALRADLLGFGKAVLADLDLKILQVELALALGLAASIGDALKLLILRSGGFLIQQLAD
jgi:hypothetical protein